jgi:hypothetical protein
VLRNLHCQDHVQLARYCVCPPAEMHEAHRLKLWWFATLPSIEQYPYCVELEGEMIPSSRGCVRGSHANEVRHGDVVASVAFGKPNIQNDKLYLKLSGRGMSISPR